MVSTSKFQNSKNAAASAAVRFPGVVKKQWKMRVGSHCSGWLAESQALDKLCIPHDIVFACDSKPAVKTLIQNNFNVLHWFDDMQDTPVGQMPGSLDLYTCGFPCQPYSSAGRNQGLADDRSTPMNAMLEYIDMHRPHMIILENVANFASRHKQVFARLVNYLRSLQEYRVHHRVLNTADYGVPQNRKIIYIVVIKRRLLRLPFQWPKPIQLAPLSKFWDRDRCGVIVKNQSIPDELLLGKTSSQNLLTTFKKLRAQNMVPRQTDAVADIGASSRFSSLQVGKCPTITAGRAKSAGYYATKLQRRLSLKELMRLQGCNPSRLNTSVISDTQLGAIIGNAMSINVMEAVIAQMMTAIGGIEAMPID